ncbi:dipeptide ABC transporter ATP-binding protein [Paenibacillus sp. GCM10012307]|uniref:ABC transporter ATP-binding protein n=1 Tax=Paenibacillus roseus TaxID=2798579 RepID=A0A934J316_9BACL|nr:ABC transporter ATP-binding protein [Paenibacillus roseus]MBJ6360558.1 ABC transporter ATP-binding protein [Paenibacillus roseus]
MNTLLDIEQLAIEFATKRGPLNAVSEVTLQIRPGETVCLVGESGSGKTITSKAIMRLIDYENGRIVQGKVLFDELDLAKASERTMQDVRGKRIAMIFQEPMSAFDPVFSIGSQIIEAIVRHRTDTKEQAAERAIGLLRKVGIPEPEARMNQYPGELSGGMLQRAMIAMALACEPELLIADEPTTALDMTIQAQILALLKELQQEYQMSILLITHDMGIAAEMADRVIVMYAGQIVEQATTEQLFRQPHHPYTKGLLRSITKLDSPRKTKLYSIEGSIPAMNDLPTGCRFNPRCPHATDHCRSESPPLMDVNGRKAACWYAGELAEADVETERTADSEDGHVSNLTETEQARGASRVEIAEEARRTESEPKNGTLVPLIEAKQLQKYYPLQRRSLLQGSGAQVKAVDNVSLSIFPGETFGLVGESGSGKSTLGRVLLQLEHATGGHVHFRGQELTSKSERQLREVRKDMQMVFQDPYGSMNPRWRVRDIIGEPLRVHESLGKAELQSRIGELLETVGLNSSWADRFPHEFSGGQRQRIGIARAIALRPSFVLADEAVSALDVSVQAQIVNLLQDLQQQLGLTYLFIGHGLHVVRHLSDRIGVMYLGKLVEVGSSEEIFRRPAHHYTQGLIASIPWPDPSSKRTLTAIEGEIPSPANPPSGCRFHTRCKAATARCKSEEPQLNQVRTGHWVACHDPLS